MAQAQTPAPHHHVRTFFAAIFGFISVNLILLSILTVWLNATLANTDQYVKTVTPIATDKVVQKYITKKVETLITENKDFNVQDVSGQLFTEDERAGKTDEELRAMVQQAANETLKTVITSESFKQLWVSTNHDVHAALLKGISEPNGTVTVNFHPVITGVIDQLAGTRFAFIKDKMDIPETAGVLQIESTRLDNARHIYNYFKMASLAIVASAIFSGIVCVMLSVHHLKTLRRILIFTGMLTGFFGIALSSTSLIRNIQGSPEDKELAITLVNILIRNLRLSFIIITVVSLSISIISKVISVVLVSRHKPAKA